MGFRFTIGWKIGVGFGLLIVSTGIIIFSAISTIKSAREVNDQVINVQSPSVDALQELKILILNTKMLITNWAYFPSGHENPDKQNLNSLVEYEYPFDKNRIMKLSEHWGDRENQEKDEMFQEIETLFVLHDSVKSMLPGFDSYADATNRFLANMMVEAGGDIDVQSKVVLSQLDALIKIQRNHTHQQSEEMIRSFNALEIVVSKLGPALIILGILIAIFTSRSIVKPVHQLKRLLLLLGKGIIPDEKMKPRNDEIGEMSHALNDLVIGFKRTTDFAREVGSGNFESEYQPLSKQDSLGHALLKMRTDLHATEQMLEKKVAERTEEVVRQKEEIEKQKKEMEVLYDHVTDSIKYAKRIQEAILPPNDLIAKLLPNSFFLYKPKDIVSGDFYWVKEKNEKIVFAAIDCTGHGVPGAFMTIVGHNRLNQAINEVKEIQPAQILDALNIGVAETLHQGDGNSNVKDGMDAAMCAIDYKTNEIQFAGAYNPLYLIRNGQVQQIKGNKFPIGAFLGDTQNFTNHTLQLEKGDTIYIFSDGYPDQFGGPKGKKFMYKNFRNTLLEIQDLSMEEQRKVLNTKIENWMADLEQVDDILVIGLRID